MWENIGDDVTVPSVVGLPFHSAREIAATAGVTLANRDADGPPIGALAWQGNYFISQQRPAGGTVVTSIRRSLSRSPRNVLTRVSLPTTTHRRGRVVISIMPTQTLSSL